MADFVFRVAPNILLGTYTLTRLAQFASTWGSNYMLIIDPVLKEYDVISKIQANLAEKQIQNFIFDEIPTAATSETLTQALQLARGAHIHGVIAVGGTKALSLGRAVASLYNETNNIYDYIEGAQPFSAALPFIQVPSMLRDTFMFADRAPVIDARNRSIKLMKTQNGICKACIIDPTLFLTLTQNQTDSMLLHTLSLAIEGYISTKASFFSDTLLEKAIQLLHYALDGANSIAMQTPKDILIAQGGCMASLGVGTSFPGVTSAIALTVHARYKISQSLVSAILLPYVIEEFLNSRIDRFANIARIMELSTDVTSPAVAVQSLIENIRSRIAIANLPARLKDLGLTIEQLVPAAQDASQLEIMNYVPQALTADDLFNLIKKAY